MKAENTINPQISSLGIYLFFVPFGGGLFEGDLQNYLTHFT